MSSPSAQPPSICSSCSTPLQAWTSTCPTCGATQPGSAARNAPGGGAPQDTPPPYASPGHGYPAYGAAPGGPTPHAGANPAPYPGANPAPGYPPPYGGPGNVAPPGSFAPPPGTPPVVVLAPKSAAVAVILNILWLGVGNIYAGQTGLGVALICADLFLWLLSIPVITLIITVPLWIVLFVVALVTSISAVNSYNSRLAGGRY